MHHSIYAVPARVIDIALYVDLALEKTLLFRAIPFKNGEGGGRNFANFRDPPIQKNGIFETPLYNKMAFLRPPYTKKCHFRDPLYNKMAFSRPPYTTNFPILTPLYKNGQNLTPLYKK